MTTRSGIKKRLKGILFTADENVMILGSEPMRRKCLLSYLDRAKKQMIDSSNCNVEEVIGHIDNVFQCLYIQRIFHASARQCRVWADEKFPLVRTLKAFLIIIDCDSYLLMLEKQLSYDLWHGDANKEVYVYSHCVVFN